MLQRETADLVVLLHFGYILFVAAGGLLVLHWPRLAWIHVPAVVWGALIEFTGRICPLTPLENRLRLAAGDSTYGGGFIDRYITPIVYPSGLTRGMQIALGIAVVLLNCVVYATVVKRLRSPNSRGI